MKKRFYSRAKLIILNWICNFSYALRYLNSKPLTFASIYNERGHFLFENAQIAQHLVIGALISWLHFGHLNDCGHESMSTNALFLPEQFGQVSIICLGIFCILFFPIYNKIYLPFLTFLFAVFPVFLSSLNNPKMFRSILAYCFSWNSSTHSSNIRKTKSSKSNHPISCFSLPAHLISSVNFADIFSVFP